LDSLKEATVNKDKIARFPREDISLTGFGASVNMIYTPNENINLFLSSAVNKNMGLMPMSVGTPISNASNLSESIYLKAGLYKFNFQASYIMGRQGLTGYLSSNDFNYVNTDLYLDYEFNFFNNKLSVKPSVAYQNAYANDKEFTVDVNDNGSFNSEGNIVNYAGALRIDAMPIESLRLIASGRYDKFNYPEKGAMSYQFTLNYSLNNTNIFRILTGKSYNGSFLVPTLISSENLLFPGFLFSIYGNKNLNLCNNTMYEIGYRTNINSSLIFDISFFNQTFADFSTLIAYAPVPKDLVTMNFAFNFENLPLVAKQNGVTASIQYYLFDGKVQIKPFVTFQQTNVENYSPYYNEKGAYAMLGSDLQEHRDSTYGITNFKGTPKFWGGFNIITMPVRNLTFSLSGYTYDDYQLHLGTEVSRSTGKIVNQPFASNIVSKFILNSHLSYAINSNFSAGINVRNILNQKDAEGFGTDKIGRLVLMNLHLNF